MVTSVVVTRAHHPLEGQPLPVLGRRRRCGRLELLVVLPDGSKTLMPADWTDLEPTRAASAPAVGSLSDLLATVTLVSALSGRREGGEQTARQSPCKEDDRAAYQLSLMPDRVPAPPQELLAQLPLAPVAAAVELLARVLAKAAQATQREVAPDE
jgi:hypothetical protein